MNYYTSTIPLPLAEKLEEKGMPYIDIDCDTFNEGTEYQRDEVWCNNTYAEVFDWLADSKLEIEVSPYINELGILVYTPIVRAIGCGDIATYFVEFCPTWHEASDAAIEKALELI